jgi:hypothetical protein
VPSLPPPPQVTTGFTDTNAVLREATVKSCLHLAPRLLPAGMHGVVLKNVRRAGEGAASALLLWPCFLTLPLPASPLQLARCLGDPEPAIRVNAVICLGRVAAHVTDAKEREATLLPGFMR